MRTLGIGILLTAVFTFGQKPPVDKKAARELLDQVAEQAGSTRSESNVIIMMHLGEAYSALDEDKGAEFLKQAFSSTAGLEGDLRSSLQSEVVKKLAEVDVDAAAELLRSMTEPGKGFEGGKSAAERVVELLLEDEEFDAAIEVLNLMPATSDYPFAAAQKLFEKLPVADSRRVVVFGRATEAYTKRSEGEYSKLLQAHWKDVPRSLALTGLAAVVNALENRNKETRTTESVETEKGSVDLGSQEAIEFFRLAALLRELDPKRLDDLLKKHADLAKALEKFPDGKNSGSTTTTSRTSQSGNNSNASINMSSGNDDDDQPALGAIFGLLGGISTIQSQPEMEALMKQWSESTKKAEQVMAEKDVRKAIAKAEEIAMPGIRAEVLGTLAKKAKDPAALEKCKSLLGDIKEPAKRFAGWLAAAEAADLLKDEKGAWDSLTHAAEDARAMYKKDSDAEKPNLAPRDFWPSIAGARLTGRLATQLCGTRSLSLWAEVTEVDFVLPAKIETARQLLGLPLKMASILERH